MNSKRILSLVLCLLLSFSCVAFADEAVSGDQTGDKADASSSEQRNIPPSVTTVVTTPEKKNETKKRFGGEWKPLAERMRPTNFEQMAVGEFIGY